MAPSVRGHQRRRARPRNFPLVAAVGAGSPRAPRLIDITWGNDTDPKITLVGKGVCFDTGGLDIKNDAGMLNMKKDMAGGATALGARAHDHGAQAQSAAARDHPGGGEFDLRHQLPAARHLHIAQGHQRRDRQYRRRRPAGPGRRAGARRRGQAGADRRFRHAHRRRARRARARGAAVFHRRRCARRRNCRGTRRPRTIRSGACRCGGLTRRCSIPRWPTPTTSAPAAMAAPSPRRCSCASSSPRHPGCISTSSPGRRPAKPGRPEGAELQTARALYAMLCARYS